MWTHQVGSPLPEKRPFMHSGEFICYIIIFCPFSASICRKCLYLRKGKEKMNVPIHMYVCQCIYLQYVLLLFRKMFFCCPARFLFMEYDNILFVL